MIYAAYLSSLIASAVMGSALAYYLWRRRSRPGAGAAAFTMLAATVWSLGYVMQHTSATLDAQIFATNIQYVGIVALPATWVAFSLQYTGRSRWLTRRSLLLLSIVPVATVVLVWTNGIDGLMYQGRHLDTSGPFTIISKTYGPWFWVHVSYNYVLMLSGMFFLLRETISISTPLPSPVHCSGDLCRRADSMECDIHCRSDTAIPGGYDALCLCHIRTGNSLGAIPVADVRGHTVGEEYRHRRYERWCHRAGCGEPFRRPQPGCRRDCWQYPLRSSCATLWRRAFSATEAG